jgi:translation initiation factor IF-3
MDNQCGHTSNEDKKHENDTTKKIRIARATQIPEHDLNHKTRHSAGHLAKCNATGVQLRHVNRKERMP